MRTDSQLLEDFVARRDQAAFAEFVSRHSGLVYHAALRCLNGHRHYAEDVSAAVFADAARKADMLRRHPAVAGWLHTAVRFGCGKLARSEMTRQRQEQEAVRMNETADTSPDAWNRLSPVIDSALQRLNDADRNAVLLRYFEGQSYSSIGTTMRTTENAARMRVDRALEKLRGHLGKLGLGSLAAALEQTLAAHGVQAAPQAFPAWLTGRALAQAAMTPAATAVSGLAAALPVATALAAVVLIVTLGGAVWSWNHARDAANALASVRQTADEADAKARGAQDSLSATAKAESDLQAELARLQEIEKRRRLEHERTENARKQFANWDPDAEGKKFLQRHPDVEAARKAFFAARFAWRFGSVLPSLHLTAEEESALMDLVVRGESIGISAPGAAYFAGKFVNLNGSDAEHTAQFGPAVRQILDEDRARVFLKQWGSSMARDTTAEVASVLWDTDTPLSPNQAAALVQSLYKPGPATQPPESFLTADQLAALNFVKEENRNVFH